MMHKSEIFKDKSHIPNPNSYSFNMYEKLGLCKKMADKLQNHGLGIHSDKICGGTKNTAQSFLGDLPNWPKCLGYVSNISRTLGVRSP